MNATRRSLGDTTDAQLTATFGALSDPTRRAVVRLLAASPRRAGELAQALSMTPPTLSRHLRVLKRSGLIADDEPAHDARVRLYRLQREGFSSLAGWLEEVEAFWGDQLAAFKAFAEAGRTDAPTALPAAPPVTDNAKPRRATARSPSPSARRPGR